MALRPRGRAAGGPREAQEAHRARTRGRRPRMSTWSTRSPVRAPRGKRGDGSCSRVVKTQKRWSTKIYKTELIEITYKMK